MMATVESERVFAVVGGEGGVCVVPSLRYNRRSEIAVAEPEGA